MSTKVSLPMASHSSPPPPQEPCVPPSPPPNWLDLPADVSASILGRLGPVEILTSAQHVCSTWRRICGDPSMWRSINISYIHIYGKKKRQHLTELYKRAIDLSSGGLLNVNIEYAFAGPFNKMEYFAAQALLRYISDRSSHLRSFRLVHCIGVFDLELIELAGKLPSLEELDLSYCPFSSKVVAAFGRLCPLLRSFKLNVLGCKLSSSEWDGEAFAIAKNMPDLHHLQIVGNELTNVGLIAILDGCQQLESLDLRRCFHVKLDADLKRRCTERIKHFRGPNDSTHDYPFDSQLHDESSNDDEFNLFSNGRSSWDLKRRCPEGIKHFRGPNDSTHDYPFDSELHDESSNDDEFNLFCIGRSSWFSP